MRFKGLDLNLLVALDALLTDQAVSVAADKIHLSQSAMSGALSRLREFFNDELLVSTGRRMVLTPRAEQLVEPVRAVLMQIKATITTKPEFDPAACERELTIVSSDYAMVAAVAAGLVQVQREAPRMTFELLPIDSRAADRIERGETDLLITLEPYISPDHPSELLFEDDYVVVAWAENPLIGDTLDEKAYFELGHVGVELGLRATVFDTWFLQSGHRSRRLEIVVPSFTLAPHMVIGTHRITTMHRRLANHYAKVMPLRLFDAPFELPKIRQVVQWHQVSGQDAAIQWVRERLTAAIPPSQ
ncbi:MAG: hypothetical protein BGN86_06140 [Caulobacterales bacterium 68-7]|nr:MAG: hypothetical protein BGN86_06140 [Caulobacterales bacterium 68-7]